MILNKRGGQTGHLDFGNTFKTRCDTPVKIRESEREKETFKSQEHSSGNAFNSSKEKAEHNNKILFFLL